MNTQTAVFGMGCFWGVQARFDKVPGVVETEVGYAGGDTPDATYEQVCSGETGHAEVVRVVFDPDKVTFSELLEQFWAGHDPTTRNRQGPDVGTQYRSAIFTTSDEQHAEAVRARDEQTSASRSNAARSNPARFGGREIVTQIEPLRNYVPAEEYHQKYLAKRGVDTCRL